MAFTLQNSFLYRIRKFVKYTGLVDALNETGTLASKSLKLPEQAHLMLVAHSEDF